MILIMIFHKLLNGGKERRKYKTAWFVSSICTTQTLFPVVYRNEKHQIKLLSHAEQIVEVLSNGWCDKAFYLSFHLRQLFILCSSVRGYLWAGTTPIYHFTHTHTHTHPLRSDAFLFFHLRWLFISFNNSRSFSNLFPFVKIRSMWCTI